jgi:hypothetical protein
MDFRAAGASALIQDVHDLPLAAAQSGVCLFGRHADLMLY